MAKKKKPGARVADLLYQALETEIGGVQIYRAALQCVQDEELSEEWREYLAQTEHHVTVMRAVCEAYGLDPDLDTPSRAGVRRIGEALVDAMRTALASGEPEATQLLAAECVVLAETKDHLNWELLSKLAAEASDDAGELLAGECVEIEEQEDQHLYHGIGWARELWLDALGLPSQLPPPEEEDDVTSAVEAARARERSRSARER